MPQWLRYASSARSPGLIPVAELDPTCPATEDPHVPQLRPGAAKSIFKTKVDNMIPMIATVVVITRIKATGTLGT